LSLVRTRPSVLHAVAGAALATVVALPLVVGVTPWAAAEPAPVEPLRTTAGDIANEGAAGARADAVVAAVQAQREEEARLAAEAQAAAERAAAEQAAAEQAAAERAAAEQAAAERAAAERASRSARTGDPKSIARSMLAERGQADQFGCLERLWQKESGWSHTATNPSSGAYGIPQSLPAGKMASAGADWRTNPATQIRWGIGYIAERYGSPCAAWRHSQARNWY
jgi:hypothetical protein